MSSIIAYAVSILLNMGVISASDVNRTSDNLRVVEKDGKTIIIDAVNGHEIIIY